MLGSDMKSDHNYAQILEMMREQGKKDNPTTIQLGVMQSADSVKVDDLVLNAEDLYIADYLLSGFTGDLKVPYVSEVTGGESVRVSKQTQITYSSGLKKGDLVVVQKLANNDMYVILVRVVNA